MHFLRHISCGIFLLLLTSSCSKKGSDMSAMPTPIVLPTPGTSASLVSLPPGWKKSINYLSANTNDMEVYVFDSVYAGKPAKMFCFAYSANNTNYEFKPVMSAATEKKPTQFYAEESGTVYACINAGYFGSGQSFSLVKYNNTVSAANIKAVTRPLAGVNTTYYPTRAAFGFSSIAGLPDVSWVYHVGTGNDLIYSYSSPAPNMLNTSPAAQPTETYPTGGTEWKVSTAVGGSPMLIKNGIINTTSRPRTAIGYNASNTIFLIAVEGDNPVGAAGLNLVELAQLMKDFGCMGAINLDGGGSTNMIINNRATLRPGDAGVERAVKSVILVKRK
jgi:Phosphodiester glycosidase